MRRHNISRNEVSKQIHANLGIPAVFSEKILNLILDIVIEGLNKNKKVKISGFGTFKLLKKKSRIGRNPKTKEEHEIKERKTVVFYPSITVRKKINDKR